MKKLLFVSLVLGLISISVNGSYQNYVECGDECQVHGFLGYSSYSECYENKCRGIGSQKLNKDKDDSSTKSKQLPPGSYNNSCSGCSVSDNKLSCASCGAEFGDAYNSVDLNQCSQDISNCNGTLTCGDC